MKRLNPSEIWRVIELLLMSMMKVSLNQIPRRPSG
jgi:hypothetical protein